MNMMTTIPTGAERTMSSLEIAELTAKDHKHVLRDIRVMLEDLGAADQFWATASVPGPNSSMRTVPIALLPKRETLILVSGYSVAMRAAIIDRWQELEAQVATAIPTHAEALRLAADNIERAEKAEAALLIEKAQVAELAPVAAVA